MNGLRLPLALSVAGHAVGLALLVWLAARLPPIVLPPAVATDAIEVVFETPQPPTPAKPAPPPAPKVEPPPVAKEEPPPPPPPPKVEPPPPPMPKVEPPPPPPVAKAEPPPVPEVKPPPTATKVDPPRPQVKPRPPPPRKPVIRKRVARPTPPPPRAPARAAPAAPPQRASLPPPPRAPAAPRITAGYRGALARWFERNKHYPYRARQRGEEGNAVLRFRVDRNGRILDYAVVRSTGYADLDAAVKKMMRGARLPPFPGDMAAAEIEVSVVVRFTLAR